MGPGREFLSEALPAGERFRLEARGGLADGACGGTVGELRPEQGTKRLPPYYRAGFVLSGDWR